MSQSVNDRLSLIYGEPIDRFSTNLMAHDDVDCNEVESIINGIIRDGGMVTIDGETVTDSYPSLGYALTIIDTMDDQKGYVVNHAFWANDGSIIAINTNDASDIYQIVCYRRASLEEFIGIG